MSYDIPESTQPRCATSEACPENRVRLRPPTPERLRRIYLGLRQVDKDESKAMTEASPWRSLDGSVKRSREAYVAEALDGTPLFAFGVADYAQSKSGACGCLWMMGTDAVADHPKALLAAAKWFLPRAVEKWPGGLINAIGAGNELHLRFIERCGAKLHTDGTFERNGMMFVPFHLTKDNLEVRDVRS